MCSLITFISIRGMLHIHETMSTKIKSLIGGAQSQAFTKDMNPDKRWNQESETPCVNITL